MEVHAHTHTPRNKWTHYLWEFLMLFLAVFCGFLAENQREHFVERHREKEYVHSLVSDLELDTLRFQQTLERIRKKIPFYDSVLVFLDNPSSFNNELPFRYYIKTNLEQIYSPVEPTILQLKNSGNLRLIKKKIVLDSILIYDSHINGSFLNQTNYVVEYNKRLIQYQEKIFDQVHFNVFLNDYYFDNPETANANYDLTLFSENKDQLLELKNLFVGAKASEIFYSENLIERKKEAISLLTFIRKEYNLD